jgi:predicted nucleic acid-binding protein
MDSCSTLRSSPHTSTRTIATKPTLGEPSTLSIRAHRATCRLSPLLNSPSGPNLAGVFGMSDLPVLQAIVRQARSFNVLDVTGHTAAVYAELKTNLAKRYLAKASRRDRPRWLEDWVDKTSGQKLQVDENDLWMCAQAKERDLVFVTADTRTQRIADADADVRLLIL